MQIKLDCVVSVFLHYGFMIYTYKITESQAANDLDIYS